MRQLKSSDAEGLFKCFEAAMNYVDIPDWTNKLIGFGCAGASVNIAAGGLRGHLEESVPWVVVIWCLVHRLELSLKDALKGTLKIPYFHPLMTCSYVRIICTTNHPKSVVSWTK